MKRKTEEKRPKQAWNFEINVRCYMSVEYYMVVPLTLMCGRVGPNASLVVMGVIAKYSAIGWN